MNVDIYLPVIFSFFYCVIIYRFGSRLPRLAVIILAGVTLLIIDQVSDSESWPFELYGLFCFLFIVLIKYFIERSVRAISNK